MVRFTVEEGQELAFSECVIKLQETINLLTERDFFALTDYLQKACCNCCNTGAKRWGCSSPRDAFL